MKIKQAHVGSDERLIYVHDEPDFHCGEYYVDFVTAPRQGNKQTMKEAVYSTMEEARHKIGVLKKIIANQ